MITIALALALAAPSIADAQSAVRTELKDPGSAKFRGIRPLHDERPGAGRAINGYCGFVNARNSYGGFAGESYFIVSYPERQVVILPPGLSQLELCR